MADVPFEWLQGTVLGRREVAEIFNVAPETVTRWAKAGMIGCWRTPRGNRCYPEAEVRRMAAGLPVPPIVRELLEQDRETRDAEENPAWKNNPRMVANAEKARLRREGKAA